MCNKLAKKREGIGTMPGVCNWQELDQDEELANCPAADIWGIGPSKAAFLKRQGITTALELKHYPLWKAKKHMTITGFRTVQELNGVRAIDQIEEAPRQVVMVSRSFQTAVFALDDLITALAEYTQEAVKRIRAEKLSCRYISVYLMTNVYASSGQYFNQLSAELPYPTSYLPKITAAANELLKRIYRPDYGYRKVMIGLTGLSHSSEGDGGNTQLDLFDEQHNRHLENEPLMKAFDLINDRYGRGTIKLACGLGNKPEGTDIAPWNMKRDFLSPRYTTNIEEIPLIY
jgi:DNA polymerase V